MHQKVFTIHKLIRYDYLYLKLLRVSDVNLSVLFFIIEIEIFNKLTKQYQKLF